MSVRPAAESDALCEAAVPSDDYGIEPCEAPAVTLARYNDDGDPDPDGPHQAPVCARHIPPTKSVGDDA